MLDDRIDFARGSLTFIKRSFANLKPFLPERLEPFSHGYGVGDGMSTHQHRVRPEWLCSGGHLAFASSRVPDGFFAAALQNAGSAEYLLVMIRNEHRRFWFYDAYMRFDPQRSCTTKKTRAVLDEALAIWNQPFRKVFYDCTEGGWIKQPSRRRANPAMLLH